MHINIAEKLINSTLFEACGKIIFELISNPENLYNSEILFFFYYYRGFPVLADGNGDCIQILQFILH